MESSRCFRDETSLRIAAISAAASGVSAPRNAALARSSAGVFGTALTAGFAAGASCDVEIGEIAPRAYTVAGSEGSRA